MRNFAVKQQRNGLIAGGESGDQEKIFLMREITVCLYEEENDPVQREILSGKQEREGMLGGIFLGNQEEQDLVQNLRGWP